MGLLISNPLEFQMSPTMSHPILLYDGVCGLCNRLVQFVLHRDRDAVFRFAPLQSALAAGILARHGAMSNPNPSVHNLDTVYVVINCDLPDESLLSRSDAILFILKRLSGQWRFAAFLLQVVPKFLRDKAYDVVARHRYRIFGRYDVCPLPREQDRNRFLDGQQ
jgi:predicted DCC family thiol-disulfide oxidoreductase YuxK